jgi:peroxiredoxin
VGYNFGVGREAPQFDLVAHDGSRVTLKQYRGDWFPIIVFLSADPAAAAPAVTALSAAADQLWGLRGQLVGIVQGDDQAARAIAEQADRVEFPLLADRDGGVARTYGARDAASSAVRNSVVIVDRSGKIVWAIDGGATAVKPADVVAGLKAVAR